MAKPKIPDKLYLQHLKLIQPGTCFLCVQPTQDNAVVHTFCAIAYTDEKEKRRKAAWDKAVEECDKVTHTRDNQKFAQVSP